MKKRGLTSNSGFTLVEVMVVVIIIIIISVVIMTVVYNARKESRDTARIQTAEQLKLGVRLYKEANGDYPDYSDGIEIGVGESIDAELEPFMPGIKPDPLADSESGDFGYWYFSDYECNGEVHDVIIVRDFELEGQGNYNEVCGGGASLPFNNSFLPIAYAGYGQGSYYGQSAYYTQPTYYNQSGYYSQGSYYSQSSYYAQNSYYTQGSYYAQSSYYSQGSYYNQSGYYTQGTYSWVGDSSDFDSMYIIIVD